MGRRKNRSTATRNGEQAAANTNISLPEGATTAPPVSEPPPPGGQEQAKTNGNGNANPKKRKASEAEPPPPLETTVIDGVTYKIQPEGLAKILLPDQPKEKNTEVFYNYIQQFNRDLTMAVTRAYGDILQSERNSPKRKHRAGVKHKKKKLKNNEGKEVVMGEAAEEAEEDNVVIQIDPSGDVGMADASNPPPADPSQPKPRFAVLDALSATGLRALRYAKEIPFVTQVTANDMSYSAVESIARNAEFNEVSHLVKVSLDNAVGHMYRSAFPAYVPAPTSENPARTKPAPSEKYHVIDLDPYGTAAPFIDSALQALEDGGLLSVTCTDAAIFASTSYPEKTFATYGGLPAKGSFSHEAGLRMVLMSIATAAGRYGLHIEPLLSLSIDYYCRVFVRVKKSPEMVKRLASKSMIVVNCDSGCSAWKVQEMGTLKERPDRGQPANPSYKYGIAQAVDSGTCEFCGFKMHIAGPMWSDPIHSPAFINHMLSNVLNKDIVKSYGTIGRITGMLKLALDEILPAEAVSGTSPNSPADGAQDEAQTELDNTTPAAGQASALTNGNEEARPDGPYFYTTKRKERQRLGNSTNALPHRRNIFSDPLALFIMPTQLSRVLHCEAPPLAAIRGAILGLGYHVTKSHCRPGSLKTNAPWSVLWRIMRAWVKSHPIKEGSLTESMAGYQILYGAHGESEDDEYKDVVFDEALGKIEEKKKGEINYQMNPNAYWGPMAKASKKGLTAEELSKAGNAEKDKRRKEEKEMRQKEGPPVQPSERDGASGRRKRRKHKNNTNGIVDANGAVKPEWEEVDLNDSDLDDADIEEVMGSMMPPPATAANRKAGQPAKKNQETPVRSRDSEGALYGMAAISASDLQRLEEQAAKKS